VSKPYAKVRYMSILVEKCQTDDYFINKYPIIGLENRRMECIIPTNVALRIRDC
jgi:hypothetical protein